MNCMILHPNGNMAIVVDEVVYDIAVAMEKFPDVTNDLIAAGKFDNSGVLVGDHYYMSSPEVKFQLNMHDDYPQPYLVQDVEQCASTYGCILERRQFNWCYLLGHSKEDVEAFIQWCSTNRPGWDAKLCEPEVSEVSEAAIAEESEKTVVAEETETEVVETVAAEIVETAEAEVVETVVAKEEPVIGQEKTSDAFVQAMWDVQNGFNPGTGRPVPEQAVLDVNGIQEAVIGPDITEETPPSMSLEEAEAFVDTPVIEGKQETSVEFVLPEECKGETWAQTWKRCRPSDVTSDAFCIEKNWEKRGDYYIIDCVMSGMRLIHSDKHSINVELSAKVCR